jgi:hypothetical protein
MNFSFNGTYGGAVSEIPVIVAGDGSKIAWNVSAEYRPLHATIVY